MVADSALESLNLQKSFLSKSKRRLTDYNVQNKNLSLIFNYDPRELRKNVLKLKSKINKLAKVVFCIFANVFIFLDITIWKTRIRPQFVATTIRNQMWIFNHFWYLNSANLINYKKTLFFILHFLYKYCRLWCTKDEFWFSFYLQLRKVETIILKFFWSYTLKPPNYQKTLFLILRFLYKIKKSSCTLRCAKQVFSFSF